jgi:hypothetical protein
MAAARLVYHLRKWKELFVKFKELILRFDYGKDRKSHSDLLPDHRADERVDQRQFFAV